jgi:cytochrome c biogenesis protein CcmG/thiol:disulfide interchange protein DsbE
MKKLLYTILFLFAVLSANSQSKFPNLMVKKMGGGSINLNQITNNGKPIVFIFWATWCGPCKRELNAIHEIYDDWVADTGVKIYAIAADDQRTVDRVLPFVNASGWTFDILLDPNGEVRRTFGVQDIPFTIVFNGDGVQYWKHSIYNPGDEYEILIKIHQLLKK